MWSKIIQNQDVIVRRGCVTGTIAIFIFIIIYGIISSSILGTPRTTDDPDRFSKDAFGFFVPFILPPKYQGLPASERTVSELLDLLKKIEESDPYGYGVFLRIHNVSKTVMEMTLPKALEHELPSTADSFKKQRIIEVHNRFTHQSVVYNEARSLLPKQPLSYTPLPSVDDDAAATTGESCDFCQHRVAQEETPIVAAGKFCYTAPNLAKIAPWHSLIIANKHHPLQFSMEEVEDYFTTAYLWFHTVRKIDPTVDFPHLFWDAGRVAGASQVHQHMHIMLRMDEYYGRGELTRLNAMHYELRYNKRNYWVDFVRAYESVGLSLRYGKCALICSLTPIHGLELIVVGPRGSDVEFARLVYVALITLIRDHQATSFSVGITFDVFNPTNRNAHYPAIAYITPRSVSSSGVADMSSFDLFGSFGSNPTDPYTIISSLQKALNNLPPVL